MRLGVDVDGVHRHAGLAVRRQLALAVAVGREVEAVARVGEIAVVVHRAYRDIQQAWRDYNIYVNVF